MKKRTTIYDIAKALNLTPSTVSRALNNHSYISEATKIIIKKKATELNYKLNTNAHNLRTGGSKTIGVIVPKINITFFSNAIAGIEAIANQHQYSIIICQSNDSFAKEVECINTLINQNVACIIISLAAETKSNDHLKDVLQHQIQLIQFDRIDTKIKTNTVLNDDINIMQDAIAHLRTQGYEKIVHLAGPQNVGVYKSRKDGFEKALLQHQLLVNKDVIIEDCYTKDSATTNITKLLSSINKPDAIIAAADFMTLTVLEVARKLHIKIPEDLGIMGYSNEPYTELTTPTITTVDQFSLEMGQTVANVFFQDIKNSNQQNIPKSIIINPKLVVRASTLRKN
jgi:LacI family transcriptional regulator, repressor for deo operon, udp, cdd, tsx, nupC, and nupG